MDKVKFPFYSVILRVADDESAFGVRRGKRVPSSSSDFAESRASVSRPAGMFEFPGQISIDAKSTLDQLTPKFRSVRDGLAELVKNSKDQYSRLRLSSRTQRQIVVIANTKTRTLGVLDFAGAPPSNYEGWTTWSNPQAGHREMAEDIEAGHGNGGKAFMVRGATEYAYMESCYGGACTAMGFENRIEAVRYQASFKRERGVLLDNVPEPNPRVRLGDFLKNLGHSFGDLPQQARSLFNERSAFTGVFLRQVADWSNRRRPTLQRIPSELCEILASHGQSALTIETCDVWVLVDGRLQGPIAPIALEPHPGFETPREFVIPDLLVDPDTRENVIMPSADIRVLRLFTSAQQLQMRPETKAKNVIRVWGERNNVANWPLQSLGVLIPAVGYLYGELRYSGLTPEDEAGAERHDLAPTLVARALKDWTRERVHDLASDLQKAMAATSKPKEREHARLALDKFRELMREYLDADAIGDHNDEDQGGDSDGDGTGRRKKRSTFKFGSRVDQLVLEPGSQDLFMPTGTSVPLRYQALEVQSDGSTKPVKGVQALLRSEPPGVVEMSESGVLCALSAGIATMWLETDEGRVSSNRRDIWIVNASDVEASAPAAPLLQGQQVKLGITFQTTEGPISDALLEAEVVPADLGKIGRMGRFTAGMTQGEASVRIRFGRGPEDYREFPIEIGSQRVEPNHAGKGSDIPLILLCGEPAPGTEDRPEVERSISPDSNLPTIIEDDAIFPGIVWINQNSKESHRVRTSVGSSSGVIGMSTKAFTHFVALKCFEILKRLHVRQQIRGTLVTEQEYMQAAVNAEMACSDFIDAAWAMSDQLVKRSGDEDA